MFGNTRRCFLGFAGLAISPFTLRSDERTTDPWSPGELLEPAAFAKILSSSAKQPLVVSVAFPVLYRQKHIIHAQFAGPGNKAEGIEALKKAVAKTSKNAEVVIYCGCCPIVRCPNIRPAYQTLKGLGYTNIRVLNLSTNFHTDWVEKGYPVSPLEK
jgi:thiosulfate/3-mercaptopyruvate sulfurtransferase